jgi:bifunctional non-homologous end joining protein LigD
MPRESVTLYYREGTSDKVYQAAIEEQGGGCVVNFAFGRRGSTLQTGTKTPAPVPFEKAKKVYDSLVRSKQAKGYTPGPDGTPYQHTDKQDRATGLLPQLLNAVDEAEVERLLDDPAHWLQEKMDGKRVLLRKRDGAVTGINRKGLTIALPEPIVKEALALPGEFILDGECVGDRYHVFDCLRRDGKPLAGEPLRERWKVLVCLVPKGVAVQVLPMVATPGDKHDLFEFLKREGGEGVVFKRHDAPYVPGRPASGGPWLKHKFVATCSAVVAPGRVGKRSVALELLDGQKRVMVGNVTIPGKTPIPKPGQIVEVRYLYAYPGGSLYQPVYLGVRDDLYVTACTITQLKYRSSASEDDA